MKYKVYMIFVAIIAGTMLFFGCKEITFPEGISSTSSENVVPNSDDKEGDREVISTESVSSTSSESFITNSDDKELIFSTAHLTLEQRLAELEKIITPEKYIVGFISEMRNEAEYNNNQSRLNYVSISDYYSGCNYYIETNNVYDHIADDAMISLARIGSPVVLFYKGELPENGGEVLKPHYMYNHDIHLDETVFADGPHDGIQDAKTDVEDQLRVLNSFENPKIILPVEAFETVLYSENLDDYTAHTAKNGELIYKNEHSFFTWMLPEVGTVREFGYYISLYDNTGSPLKDNYVSCETGEILFTFD